MSRWERRRAFVAFGVGNVIFVGLQVLQEWDVAQRQWHQEAGGAYTPQELALARPLSHASALVNSLAFAGMSYVVILGAWFQCNVLAGLSKTLDCWCGDMLQNPDFEAGVESWNWMQAMLPPGPVALADA